MTFRVVAIISGRGSNMESLARHASGYEISAVVSNKEDAKGLEIARGLGLKTVAIPRSKYATVAEQKRALFRAVCELNPDLVALAGYMQIVEPYFISRFRGRIVNIHPSLLPEFPGLDTHQRALDAGVKEHGCSVHYVDEGLDTGAVIAQAKIMVPKKCTEAELAALVLTREHQIYPWVVANIAAGAITFSQDQVTYSSTCRKEALSLNFHLP